MADSLSVSTATDAELAWPGPCGGPSACRATVGVGPLVLHAHSTITGALAYLTATFTGVGEPGHMSKNWGMRLPVIRMELTDSAMACVPPIASGQQILRDGFSGQPTPVVASLVDDHVDVQVPRSPYTCSYELRRRRSTIEIIGSDQPHRRNILTSVAREVWRRTVENLGGTVLHASAVTRPSGAWLFVGPKGAGKTSSALSLASAGFSALLDNDRTAILPNATGTLYALPVPLSIRVAPGTLKGLGSWPHIRNIQPRLLGGLSTPAAHGRSKVNLTRAEAACELGLRLSPGARVAGIVLPCFERGRTAAATSQVNPDEVRRTLRRYLYLPKDPGFPDDLLLLRRRSEREIREAGLKIAEQLCELPAVRYQFPGASPTQAELLAGVIEAMEDRNRGPAPSEG
jgi:hypothetical protein